VRLFERGYDIADLDRAVRSGRIVPVARKVVFGYLSCHVDCDVEGGASVREVKLATANQLDHIRCSLVASQSHSRAVAAVSILHAVWSVGDRRRLQRGDVEMHQLRLADCATSAPNKAP
jgi:hypothetical protein